MKQLTIKKKITLWYTGIIAVVLGTILVLVLLFVDKVGISATEEEISAAVTGFSSNINFQDDSFYLDGDTEFYDDGIMFCIYDKNGRLLYGTIPTQFPEETILKSNTPRMITGSNRKWMIYDSVYTYGDDEEMWVRGITSVHSIELFMQTSEKMLLIVFPLLIILIGAISYEWKYKTIRDIFRRKKKAILVDDPVVSFRFVESYKKLAAKVEYRMAKNEQKVLVVTSVSENEGKSTVAANLAITLAEQSKRVLLVDGDIRRPSQFLIFGMEPKEENELGEYLRGNGSLADVMVPCTRKHMLFMGGKNCYSSSTEMLNSDSFYKLMTACRKFVDYVIIDTPPAGIIGDAQIFAHCADAVMIVAKQNYMLAEDINEVMDAFRDKEGKVLGVVLNGVRSFSGLVDSPVGHYYGKYSKYGRYGNYGRSKGM